jgi:hypothetical protein
MGDLVIELANLRIQHRQERAVILAETARDGRQRQTFELPLPPRREPALPRGRLEVTPRQHGDLGVAELTAEPDQLNAVADELAGLAQGGRRDPDRRQEVPGEQKRQALRVHAIIPETRGGDGASVRLPR